jgi:hypothetical protein
MTGMTSEEAMVEYQRTLNLDPRHLKALFNLGNLHAQHGSMRRHSLFRVGASAQRFEC